MAIYFQGKKISRMGALTEPSTYDADITPENMQRGMTAYAQGKKVVGTGKCFAFASYGIYGIEEAINENGETEYCFVVNCNSDFNIIFLSAKSGGDIFTQDKFKVIEENEKVKIGTNITTATDIKVSLEDGFVFISMPKIENEMTQALIFIGKDNKI